MGGVGSVGVVVEPPVLDDDACFEEAVEAPRVEQFVAETSVERLDPGVLPWRAGIDEQRPSGVGAISVVDGVRDELGPVIEVHVGLPGVEGTSELACPGGRPEMSPTLRPTRSSSDER